MKYTILFDCKWDKIINFWNSTSYYIDSFVFRSVNVNVFHLSLLRSASNVPRGVPDRSALQPVTVLDRFHERL
jgi:hypothetical protein